MNSGRCRLLGLCLLFRDLGNLGPLECAQVGVQVPIGLPEPRGDEYQTNESQ
ncbi:MAG: hypothetical protein R3C44_17355 [Chloroflexota bacterium]